MSPELEALLAGDRLVIDVPVWWGDQDAFGHVNNTIPLRWFESARIAYCGRIGLADLMAARRIGPILASITCNYRRPLTFPDAVHVSARITRIGRTSLTMEHRAVSESHQALAVDGVSTLVVFDYAAGKPHPVPDEIRSAIEALEARQLGATATDRPAGTRAG